MPRDRVYDVPQYMIDDEMMIMAAEAAHSDVTKPTQDLLATDAKIEAIRASQAEMREKQAERSHGNGG